MKAITKQILELQEQRDQLVQQNKNIINIGFSTRKQLINILGDQQGKNIETFIFIDSNVATQQKAVSFAAMSLLADQNYNGNIITPDSYIQDIKGNHVSQPKSADFEELFNKFGQVPYINYQDAIDQLGAQEAYEYIEMYLARKKFISQEISTQDASNIIVQSSHIKGANSIFTKGEVDKRTNRDNLFLKVDYQEI